MRRALAFAVTLIAAAVAGVVAVAPPAAAESFQYVLQSHRYNPTQCLDASISNGVRLMPCALTSKFQRWTYDGAWHLVRYNGTMCLDGSTTNGVHLLTCDGDDTQQWYLTGSLLAGFNVRLVEGGGTMCLDGSTSNGIRLRPCDEASSFQRWDKLEFTVS